MDSKHKLLEKSIHVLCMNQTTNTLQTFFGITTDSINYANLCALGIPWDKSSTFRQGAMQGPEYIRHASTAKLYNHFSENGDDLKAKWQILDIGDVQVTDMTISDARSTILETIRKYNKYGMKFFFLGGDHLITYFTFLALKQLNDKRVGLVYFDAHPDLYESYENDNYSHACVVKRIIDETNIEPENIVQVGIRATTPEQKQFADSVGIKTFSTKDIKNGNPQAIGEQIKNLFPNYIESVYLSIDLDVLDPAFAPGVGNPEPAGLSTREVIEIIHGFKDLKINAFDIVELSPKFDFSGISAFATAKIMKEVLGIL